MNRAYQIEYDYGTYEYIAYYKGHEGRGPTEKDAIHELNKELRSSLVRTRRKGKQ